MISSQKKRSIAGCLSDTISVVFVLALHFSVICNGRSCSVYACMYVHMNEVECVHDVNFAHVSNKHEPGNRRTAVQHPYCKVYVRSKFLDV